VNTPVVLLNSLIPHVEEVVFNQKEPSVGAPVGRPVDPTKLARSTSALRTNT